MSSVKQKALAASLLVAFGTLVPLQTVSAQLAICNTNDLSSWIYTPGTPTEDISNPPSTFVNKVTGEVQGTTWLYKATTDFETGMPTGTGYWTRPAESEDDVPPQIASSDPTHPPVTQDFFTYRTLGFVDLSENRNEQILRQNRETGILELSGPWPFRDQWTVVDWTEEQIRTELGNTAYNNYLLYQQGMAGGDVIGDIFNIASAVVPSLIIGGFTAGIGAAFGIPTALNIAIPQELVMAIKQLPLIGNLLSIGCYDPTGSCSDLASGVTQEVRGVANDSGFNTFSADYSGSFIQINPLSLSLIGYGVGSDSNWTFKVGPDAVTCTAPIAVAPVIEITPPPADTPPDTTPVCLATGADTQVYAMKITGGVYAASDIRDFAANMANAMSNSGVNTAVPGTYAYNAMATPFTYGGVSGETATCPQVGGCGFYQLPATNGAYFTLDGTKIGSNITVKHGWDATVFFGLCKPWDALSVDEFLNYSYDCDALTASGQASDWRGATKTLALWAPSAADSSACPLTTKTCANGAADYPTCTTCTAPKVLENGQCVEPPPVACPSPKVVINGVCVEPLTTCPDPTTQEVTVACDPDAAGVAATSGLVTRRQTKSAYPACAFPTPVTVEHSTYVSDTCVYPPSVCTAPLTETFTVACDLNAEGVAAVSGSVTRRQAKSAYPACAFPLSDPRTAASSDIVAHSTYVSDDCAYPPPALAVACYGAPANPYLGQPVTWSSSVSGNSDWYIYEWGGTDDLFDTVPTTRKFYSTVGLKEASLTVTDPKTGQTARATCVNGANVTSVTVRSCTASLSATPSTVLQGQTTMLTWAVSDGALCASSCSGGSGFDTGGKISGFAQASTLPTPPTTSYTLTCTAGTYGPPPPVNATVTVISPDVVITANGWSTPPRVDPTVPDNVTIAWSPVDPSAVSSCSVTRDGVLWREGVSSAGVVDSVTAQTTYAVTCENEQGARVTRSIVVNTLIEYEEF